MNRVFVADAIRSPVGRVDGSLAAVELEHLLAPLIQHLIKHCEIEPGSVDEVIVGNAAGPGGNPARLALLQAGLPVSVPGLSVDRQCGSGLEAIRLGAQLIRSGAARLVIAGGAESPSTAPLRARPVATTETGLQAMDSTTESGSEPGSDVQLNGLSLYRRARFSPDSLGDPEMIDAAEMVAERYQIDRRRQDQFALNSHRLTLRAEADGELRRERLPYTLSDGSRIEADECPRADTSLEILSQLHPLVKAGGTVTAGNACPINDGASLVLLSDRLLHSGPHLEYLGSSAAGVDPNYLGTGPVPAVRQLLETLGMKNSDIARIEFNEAFAAQVLACVDLLELDPEKVNPHGGALALGHPYGASGAILVTRLYHQLGLGAVGLATIGIGGGMGLAGLFRRTL